MLLRLTLLCLASFLGHPVLAQEWNVRPWDTRLSVAQVRTLVTGQAIAFPDGSVANYASDGSYSYIYNGGNRFDGTWSIGEDGAVCTTFESGASRCDLYVLQGGTPMLINEQGGRFLTEQK